MSIHQKKSIYKPNIEIIEGQSDNDYGNEYGDEQYGSEGGLSVESFLYLSEQPHEVLSIVLDPNRVELVDYLEKD